MEFGVCAYPARGKERSSSEPANRRYLRIMTNFNMWDRLDAVRASVKFAMAVNY